VYTANLLFRWLPMLLFPLIAAQKFSERGGTPLVALAIFPSVQRWLKNNPATARDVDVSYPYFILCVFAAGFHPNPATHGYFFGEFVLVAWAIWPVRSRRHGVFVWLSALLLAVMLGYAGESGIGALVQATQRFNAQWMSWMLRSKTDATQSITSMGRIGQLKLSSHILIRLEPQNGSPVPDYLREATYRFYHPANQDWQAGSAGNEFTEVSAERGGVNWILQAGETNHLAAVRIACYLNGWSADLRVPEGLLPLPSTSRRLENLPVVALKMNKTGAVLASGPGLVIFNAHYGSGATFDSPPEFLGTNKFDLAVPTNEIPALQQVIAEMKLTGAGEEQKLSAVQNFFADKFTYSLWQGRDKLATTNFTVLGKFLLQSRSGHCEYFATATVLLLRQLGIPARYAVGYAVHEKNGPGYVVRGRDAHAWCLVWNSQKNVWQDFDTTPASWIAAEEQRASMWQWLSDAWSWIKFQAAKLRWGQANLRPYILWGLIPLLAALVFQIIFRRRKRKKVSNPGAAEKNIWPGLDSEFYRLEKQIAAHGAPRQPGEPLADWLERLLAEPALTGLREPLKEILRLHYRHRFDPPGLNPAERDLLAQKVRACLEQLSGR
jgi:hypothetical protein